MKPKGSRRLSMYLPTIVHLALKEISHEQRITITSYVLAAILERIKRDNIDR